MNSRHRPIFALVLVAALALAGCASSPCVVTANTISATDNVVKAGAKAIAILCGAKKLPEADCAVARAAQDKYIIAATAAVDLGAAACKTDSTSAAKAQAIVQAAAENALVIFNTFIKKAETVGGPK
jgi:hypothetical protein